MKKSRLRLVLLCLCLLGAAGYYLHIAYPDAMPKVSLERRQSYPDLDQAEAIIRADGFYWSFHRTENPRDMEKAVSLLFSAADQGSEEAQCLLLADEWEKPRQCANGAAKGVSPFRLDLTPDQKKEREKYKSALPGCDRFAVTLCE
jgi:hypothetical protein